MKLPRIQLKKAIKRYLPRSFLGRSIMIIVTPLILLQIVSTWIFYDRHWTLITRRLSDSVASEIGFVIDEMGRFENEARTAWLSGAAGDLGYYFNFKTGEILPNAPAEVGSGILDTRLAYSCLLYTSPSPRDKRQSRMPSSA